MQWSKVKYPRTDKMPTCTCIFTSYYFQDLLLAKHVRYQVDSKGKIIV